MPSRSSGKPKVKRVVPVCRSMPIVPIISPAARDMSAFNKDPSLREEAAIRAMTIRAKYSGGWKTMATRLRSGARTMSTTTPNVPARKEPMADMPRALPARPFSAS